MSSAVSEPEDANVFVVELKETHLSSPFASRSSTATGPPPSDDPQTSPKPTSSLNLPSVTTGKAHSEASDGAPAPVLAPPASAPSPSQPQQHQQPPPPPQPAPESSTEEDGAGTVGDASSTTSTVKPGLLSVHIDCATGLSLPPSLASATGPNASVGLAQSLSASGSASPRKNGTSGGGGPPPSAAAQSRGGATRRPPVYLVLEYDKTQVILDATGGTVDNPVWDKVSNFDVSRLERLSIQIYTRVPISSSSTAAALNSYSEQANSPFSSSLSGSMGARQQAMRRRYEDVFLGSCRIAADTNNTVWQPLTSGTGKIKLKVEFRANKNNKHLNIEDFDLLKVIGKGSFGKVMQVRKHDTQRIYALKTIRKAHIISRSEVNHTLAERTVLAQIDNPFIVPLKFSFQSPEKLYLVLAFVNGGELFHHLQREGRFDLNRSRFYTAELLCALECLHEYNVIYRDLKPENILLDYTGHIALCDFGLCKLNMEGQEKTNTFCGTPEYLAPELLLGQGYSKVVDWWTLGVLFYEMLTGLPPFYDQDTNEMYRKILQDPLRFPDDMDREARSLLQGLLIRDPKKRLGINGAAEIKAHPFFAQIDWKRLMAKKYAAPFKPAVESATDTSNFDQEFTSEEPTDSVVDKDFYLSESVQQQFGGWTYTNTDSKLASSGRW